MPDNDFAHGTRRSGRGSDGVTWRVRAEPGLNDGQCDSMDELSDRRGR